MQTLNSSSAATNLLSENCLLHELSEWERIKNQYPSVEAVPLESNIYDWHCNIVAHDGVFIGLIFHIIIKFSQNYPFEAPLVYLCNPIPHHPNVDEMQYVLLRKLVSKRNSSGYCNGWTPGYGVTTILKGLKSCLFEQKVCDASNYRDSNTKYRFSKESLKAVHENVRKFKCDGCGHCFETPYPVPSCIMLMEKECNYLRVNNINTIINDKNIKQNKLARKCSKLLDIFGDNS